MHVKFQRELGRFRGSLYSLPPEYTALHPRRQYVISVGSDVRTSKLTQKHWIHHQMFLCLCQAGRYFLNAFDFQVCTASEVRVNYDWSKICEFFNSSWPSKCVKYVLSPYGRNWAMFCFRDGSCLACFGPVSSPLSYPRPPGNHVVTRLPLPHNSMYHVISPSSSCLERKVLRQSMQRWKLGFLLLGRRGKWWNSV
jgi:hypothetical protein